MDMAVALSLFGAFFVFLTNAMVAMAFAVPLRAVAEGTLQPASLHRALSRALSKSRSSVKEGASERGS